MYPNHLKNSEICGTNLTNTCIIKVLYTNKQSIFKTYPSFNLTFTIKEMVILQLYCRCGLVGYLVPRRNMMKVHIINVSSFISIDVMILL